MVPHEPGDEPRVIARQALLEAEGFGVHRAEIGVVAAASLGDVVENCGEVGELGLRQRAEYLRELRELVVVALEGESTEIAHDEERVRIDRVGVEQVVLHAADDPAECGDIAAQHAIEVHAPELVRDPGRRPQDLEEQAVIARVLAEFLVDQPEMLGDEADGPRAHAPQPRILLEHHEELEKRRGMAREDVVGHRLQVFVTFLEIARQGQDRRVTVGNDLLAELLQEQLVEPAHEHRGPVVALHELLDRERIGRILVAEHAREPDLVVEQQAILAAPADEVQRKAHAPEPGLRGLELRQFPRLDEAVRGEPIERLRPEMALCDPGDRLQVPKAARSLLDVRFEVVRGVVESMVALGLLAELGVEEIPRRPHPVRREGAAHGVEQFR